MPSDMAQPGAEGREVHSSMSGLQVQDAEARVVTAGMGALRSQVQTVGAV